MNIRRKYGLALKVLVIVIALVLVKVVLNYYDLQFMELTTLFATIIGGAIFLVGLILTGTLSDYKESEKVPSEMVASLENLLQEGVLLKKVKPEFDLNAYKQRLLAVVASFREDIRSADKAKPCLERLSDLSDSFAEMERFGISTTMSRVKSEQGNLSKVMLRAFQIKETSFIPAAYAIVEVISIFMIIGLMSLRLEPFNELLLTLSIIIYIFLYMILLVEDLDDPFQGTGSYADVNMYLLDEFEAKVKT